MQTKHYKTAALILAAGSGSRMNMPTTKQRLIIAGKSVLKRSIEVFDGISEIDLILVVTRKDEYDFAVSECEGISKIYSVVVGGNTRAESAKNGFMALPADVDFVMIHDAARCLVTREEIKLVLDAACQHGAATASYPIVDSIKKVDESGKILSSVSRDDLRAVATPQAFSYEIYKSAIDSVSVLGADITDDNSLVEKIGINPFCVMTSRENIKITASTDLALAEFIIKNREIK